MLTGKEVTQTLNFSELCIFKIKPESHQRRIFKHHLSKNIRC